MPTSILNRSIHIDMSSKMAPPTDKVDVSLDFPSELTEKLSEFHKSLEAMEESLKPVFATTVSEMTEKFNPLDRAKIDLVSAYALNSLFWIYLKTKGKNAKDHDVKVELERIRAYMSRVKSILDKKNAPKLNSGAAKRFVRNALWTQPTDKNEAKKRKKKNDEGDSSKAGEPKKKPIGKHKKEKNMKKQKTTT